MEPWPLHLSLFSDSHEVNSFSLLRILAMMYRLTTGPKTIGQTDQGPKPTKSMRQNKYFLLYKLIISGIFMVTERFLTHA